MCVYTYVGRGVDAGTLHSGVQLLPEITYTPVRASVVVVFAFGFLPPLTHPLRSFSSSFSPVSSLNADALRTATAVAAAVQYSVSLTLASYVRAPLCMCLCVRCDIVRVHLLGGVAGGGTYVLRN